MLSITTIKILILIRLHLFVNAALSPEIAQLQENLRPSNYDKSQRPNVGGQPVVVIMDMVIVSLGPINSNQMEFSVSLFLRQEWTDPRLSFNSSKITSLNLGNNYVSQIWVPDLYFLNSRDSKQHQVTTPNVYLLLNNNGHILFSQRLTSTIGCDMDLHSFPHDRQSCKVSLESYGYKTTELQLQWSKKRKPAEPITSLQWTEFNLETVETLNCTGVYETGAFACLGVTLNFSRAGNYYVLQTYVPSALICGLSWAGFWVDYRAVPARVSVGLLTVLTIITQRNLLINLSKVPYLKAIDIWMLTNLLFVFAAYLQYSLVDFSVKKEEEKAKEMNENILENRLCYYCSSRQDLRSDTKSAKKEEEKAKEINENILENRLCYSSSRQDFKSDTQRPSRLLNIITSRNLASDARITEKSSKALNALNLECEVEIDTGEIDDDDGVVSTKKKFSQKSKYVPKKSVSLQKKEAARRIDFYSRVLFPTCYAIFVTIYWYNFGR